MSRSGSLITDSVSSASTRSMLMSEGEILPRCAISANVFVRSTMESRPSSAERSVIERCLCVFSTQEVSEDVDEVREIGSEPPGVSMEGV